MLHGMWVLVPQPGIEPTPPVVEEQSLNHWTAGEVPEIHFLVCFLYLIPFISIKYFEY